MPLCPLPTLLPPTMGVLGVGRAVRPPEQDPSAEAHWAGDKRAKKGLFWVGNSPVGTQLLVAEAWQQNVF